MIKDQYEGRVKREAADVRERPDWSCPRILSGRYQAAADGDPGAEKGPLTMQLCHGRAHNGFGVSVEVAL